MKEEPEFIMDIELRRIKEQEEIRMKASSWLVIAFAVMVLIFWVGAKGAAAGWSSAG